MGMDQLRRRRDSAGELYDRFGKENKSLGVILVAPAVCSIDTGPVEVLIATDQVDLNSVRAGGLDDVGGRPFAPEVDLELAICRADFIFAFANGPVIRHDDADVMAKFFQFVGQNADLVPQITGRTERGELTGCH